MSVVGGTVLIRRIAVASVLAVTLIATVLALTVKAIVEAHDGVITVESVDYCERENCGGYAGGLLPDSTPSLRRDQEQEPAHDGSRQTCRYEQSKPADYHLPLAAPVPTLDRPERQFGCHEERCRHDRCTGVERAVSQAQKKRVG
ncbi:MAG: hypothetical protein ACXVRI_05590, partial [Gaiellaceae bacterium]